MKKLFFFIFLFCLCVVFTGCGGSSNSSEGLEYTTLKVTLPKSLFDVNSSVRAVTENATPTYSILLNDIVFDRYVAVASNYVFSKVVSRSNTDVLNIGKDAVIVVKNADKETCKIVFQGLTGYPVDIAIAKDGDTFSVKNGSSEQTVIEVNGKPSFDRKEVVRLQITKISELTASLTFFNKLNECQGSSDWFKNYDWKISALDKDLNVIYSWKKSDNDEKKLIDIAYNYDGSFKVFITESGKASLYGRSLDNTNIKIDYIQNGSTDVVSPSVLEKGIYYCK